MTRYAAGALKTTMRHIQRTARARLMTVDEDELEAQIAAEEGVNLTAYKDSKGIWTIGIGHNMEADPDFSEPYEGATITQGQCDALFKADIAQAIADVDSHLPWVDVLLTDARKRVIIDMCYNMGIGGLLGFHNMLQACQAGDWPTAVAEMQNSKWQSDVKGRADRLESQMLNG
jgi:lysozyme